MLTRLLASLVLAQLCTGCAMLEYQPGFTYRNPCAHMACKGSPEWYAIENHKRLERIEAALQKR